MKRQLAAIVATDMVGFSRLMERDEADTLSRQKHHRATLIDPAIHDCGGRIVKSTGDGLILVFDGLHDAVDCAVAIQTRMNEREADRAPDTRIQYRIGINIGDVMIEDGDVFGDAVNIAARLETLAEPGAVCLSDMAYQTLTGADAARFSDLGLQNVKNIKRALRVWQWSPMARTRTAPETVDQKISFCTAPDGVQLAYPSVGSGPVVLKAPNWMNHLDYDWRSPIFAPLFKCLARDHRLVRFDQRGNGLSDWEIDTISEDAMIHDMEAVAMAAKLNRFVLFGQSQGCAYCIRYAAEHPEQVAGLVLIGGYLRGPLRRNSAEQSAMHKATTAVIRQGWGATDPAFRHMFTESLMPEASPLQKENMDEFQRLATSADNAARINDMNASVDVSTLASQVKAPALVLHAQGDRRVPLAEGRRMAATLPNAEFVSLPGSNHILVDGTNAFDQFALRAGQFLAALDL